MTKLEEKLVELGYRKLPKKNDFYITYNKLLKGRIIVVQLSVEQNEFTEKIFGFINPSFIIDTQQDIDNLQQAFNEMQKDLEILRECEE